MTTVDCLEVGTNVAFAVSDAKRTKTVEFVQLFTGC